MKTLQQKISELSLESQLRIQIRYQELLKAYQDDSSKKAYLK